MKPLIKKILQIIIPILIFSYLIFRLSQSWSQIFQYQFSINPFYFIFSFILLICVILFLGWIWKQILESTAIRKVDLSGALYIYIYAYLLKYIPGGLGIILGKVYLGNKKWKIPKKEIFAASIYEHTSFIISSFLIGWYAINKAGIYSNFNFKLNIALLVIVVIAFANLSRIFPFIFNIILIFNKKIILTPPKEISSFKLLSFLLLYLFNRLLMGTAFLFLMKSIVAINNENIIFIISSFILANIIGFLAVFTPGGLGVREGILVLLLQTIIPLEMAIIISIISRIWITLGDGILALSVFMPKRYINNTYHLLKNLKYEKS